MYLLAKIFQATGLALMGWGFMKNYPALMPHNMLLLSGTIFIIGWVIQTYMLKK